MKVNIKILFFTLLFFMVFQINNLMSKELSQEEKRILLNTLKISYNQKNFFESINNDDLTVTKLFIDTGMDINAKDEMGNTPLMIACKKGNFEIVKMLVERGADLNIKTNSDTALILAKRSGFNNICNFLIKKGANLNDLGITPLITACDINDTNSIKLLLDSKEIDINAQEKITGYTALMIACEEKNFEIAKLLIDKGANLNLTNINNATALSITYYSNPKNIEFIKFLINNGADINITPKNKFPLLLAQCLSNPTNFELIDSFIKKGANVNAKCCCFIFRSGHYHGDNDSMSLLKMFTKLRAISKISEENYLKIIKLLKKHGAK